MKKIAILLLSVQCLFAGQEKQGDKLDGFLDESVWGVMKYTFINRPNFGGMILYNYQLSNDVLRMNEFGVFDLRIRPIDFFEKFPQAQLTDEFDKLFFKGYDFVYKGWSSRSVITDLEKGISVWSQTMYEVGVIQIKENELIDIYSPDDGVRFPYDLSNPDITKYTINKYIINDNKFEMIEPRFSHNEKGRKVVDKIGRREWADYNMELFIKTLKKGQDTPEFRKFLDLRHIIASIIGYKNKNVTIPVVSDLGMGWPICFFPAERTNAGNIGERNTFNLDFGSRPLDTSGNIKEEFIKPNISFAFNKNENVCTLLKRNLVISYYNNFFTIHSELAKYEGKYDENLKEIIWKPNYWAIYEPSNFLLAENLDEIKWKFTEEGIVEYKKNGDKWELSCEYFTQPNSAKQ